MKKTLVVLMAVAMVGAAFAGPVEAKKKKKKKPPACLTYQPGEAGTGFETTVVTDEATEEAPIEVTIAAPMGLGNDLGVGVYDMSEATFHNIQVDTADAETGLYARYEFEAYEDLDLYLDYADGAPAANSGAFNQAPVPGVLDGTGNGGGGGTGYEQLDGIRTADCAGYTARLNSWLTPGGDRTLKLWLGEVQNDPAPPAD